MNTDSEQVRPQHSRASAARVVAVTGAADGVGRLLLERLLTASCSGSAVRPVAIDGRRGDLGDATWRVVDVCDPRMAGRIGDVDILVHLADDRSVDTPRRERRTRNLRSAQTVLTAAAAERVPHVVLVTSTMVYGARPDAPVPLPESAPVVESKDTSLVGDFCQIEELAQRARRAHPGLTVTVVRPAPLAGPGIDSLLTRHFAAPRLLTVKGCTPSWQFCHVEDLADALAFLVAGDRGFPEAGGSLAVGCDGALTHADVVELTGMRGFELPANVAFGATRRLHRVGITPVPPEELRFLVYPCVVECATLRAAGWRPRYDNASALRAALEVRGGAATLVGRNIGRREATITAASAAGAAVAAVGTAAAVRHLRRRRRG